MEPTEAQLATALKHHQAGQYLAAREQYEAVLRRNPAHAEALHLLGVLHHQSGNNPEAVRLMRLSVLHRPDHGPTLYNLAVVLQEMARAAEARQAYQAALQLDPHHRSALQNLGNLEKEEGNFGAAERCYRQLTEVAAEDPHAWSLLGVSLRMQGRIDDALACFERAMERAPDDPGLHSGWLFARQYHDPVTAQALSTEHAAWDARHGRWADDAPASTNPTPASISPAAHPLRLGFVSPDLGYHPVGLFLAPLLEELAKQFPQKQLTTVCYSHRRKHDGQTERIRAASSGWRDVGSWSDEQVCRAIRDDQIDVLFDLAGHTDRNRLPIFARRPASTQISWIGYVGTTGLEAMTHVLADRHQAPESEADYYAEQILHLPHGYVAYEPPPYAPPIASPPSARRGYVTFGCLNNPCKLSPTTVGVWARIVQRLPQSRLLLKYKGFDDPAVRERLTFEFREAGAAAEQIEYRGDTTHVDHLEALNEVDVALDPAPYSGGISTCEALWMGVPVITRPGPTFASRHALSHVLNSGSPETIAACWDGYVERALHWAEDEASRAHLRRDLRATMAESPLCDLTQFAHDFLRTVRAAWQATTG